MRRWIAICISAVGLLVGCAAQTAQKQPQLYTAYNIWQHAGELYCINYKMGNTFIPAGTAVNNVEVKYDRGRSYIRFRVAETNRLVSLSFNDRWHPGQTAPSYLQKMLTEKNHYRLTDGLNSEEIRAIKGGYITVGMSKRAVLISYGIPPEHYTSNLSGNEWYYWINKMRKKKICFDDHGRAQRCGRVPSSNRL